jgi:hypothetical protein
MWLYVRIILKYILEKKDVVEWAGLIWLGIETSGWLFEPLDSTKW